MRPTSGGRTAFVAGFAALLAGCAAQLPGERGPDRPGARVAADTAAVNLTFGDFFLPGAALEPSPKLLGAAGRRARILGFMAHMELPPVDGFYLTSRPLFCGEGGAGTADLPPETVLVKVLSAPTNLPFVFVPGPLDITGTLDVGRREEPDGTVSHVRLLLNGPPGPAGVAARSATNANHGEQP